ncbi:uncharacterized protein LACBIDRAFT_313883 [Laccaria bicolor S238N-H82]|uniref:Predicted protein n=1 Tax=Laccaria bicolor (strain S238N-H82 / ATCC MYA-4686) TaxID=486041 RepID=B0D122_LACBS|nr:uncharacterized protein LACBIDRAFT_313883 [Laccaria bicolor S238N-H82]EDR11556.1 predicted protein [Laccaria bicolor S238N-H82]|eukprot:XP_001877453.1 predicted protein [Laccaria bicolor S238N-H82]
MDRCCSLLPVDETPTAMKSNSPSPHSAQKNVCPPSPTMSPAQAIAEAWKRESLESREKWMRVDANVGARYDSRRTHGGKTKM